MDNMYRRSMLFLTFIQGPKTIEWVHSIGNWLELSVHVMTTCDYDPDANFFAYYFPITTLRPFCLNYYPALFSFCLSLCTFITASPTQPGS